MPRQAGVLAIADVYRVIGLILLLIVPVVFMMKRIPAPAVRRIASDQSTEHAVYTACLFHGQKSMIKKYGFQTLAGVAAVVVAGTAWSLNRPETHASSQGTDDA